VEPVPRKQFMECPRCRSPQVRVPWEPARIRLRERAFRGLVVLWLTSVAWVVLGLVWSKVLWVAGLSAYALTTLVVSILAYRSTRAYRCVACGLKWHS